MKFTGKILGSLVLFAGFTGSSLLNFSNTALSESIDSLEEKKQEIQGERNLIEEDISDKNTEIEKLIKQQEEMLNQINELDDEISDTQSKVETVNNKLEELKKEIFELQNDIEELVIKIEERTSLLEERARAIQLTGGSVDYVEVLLGAEDFGDFIDRFSAVNQLMSADRDIMEEHQQDQETLKNKKTEMENRLQEQKNEKDELDQLISNLSSKKEEKNQLIEKLEQEQRVAEKERKDLEEKESDLYSLEEGIEADIMAEQERQKELARQKELEKQAEIERQSAEEERTRENNNEVNQTVESAVSNSQQTLSSGDWSAPTNGRFTTEFGYDILNGKPRFHYGMDIAGSTGTPILAAADGYVTTAETSDSYGNWIILTHSINGQTYSTVYAHMSSLSVGQGQYVEKGQQIGSMGNTGFSFGTHLHFELHEGVWNNGKSNAVNPRKYVNW